MIIIIIIITIIMILIIIIKIIIIKLIIIIIIIITIYLQVKLWQIIFNYIIKFLQCFLYIEKYQREKVFMQF